MSENEMIDQLLLIREFYIKDMEHQREMLCQTEVRHLAFIDKVIAKLSAEVETRLENTFERGRR